MTTSTDLAARVHFEDDEFPRVMDDLIQRAGSKAFMGSARNRPGIWALVLALDGANPHSYVTSKS